MTTITTTSARVSFAAPTARDAESLEPASELIAPPRSNTGTAIGVGLGMLAGIAATGVAVTLASRGAGYGIADDLLLAGMAVGYGLPAIVLGGGFGGIIGHYATR